jgi:uncharacterized protein involved in exopolysaccharide biosynthesis
MNVQQFLLALRGRFWIFITLLTGTVVAAVCVTLLMPKTYEATVSVLVDNRDEQSLSAAAAQPARAAVGYMQTQMDVIRSERVARKVVEDLKLAEDPAAKRAFAASGARGSIEDWIASGLLTTLKVDTSQSSVILITYGASDPKFAATVANAFAEA